MAKSRSLDDALAAALAEQQAGRYAAAAARFERILNQAPDWLLALVRYAELSEQQGELARARQLWERAGARAPGNAGVQTNLAKLRRQQGEPEAAIAAASAALAAQPGQAAARFNRALAARDAGYYADAAADLDRLLADHPGQAEFLAERGRIALALDDPATARTVLERAHRAGGAEPDCSLNRATALNELGEPKAALAALDAVAAAGGSHPDCYVQRAFALQQLGDDAGAEAALESALAYGTDKLKAYIALALYQDRRAARRTAEATLQGALAWAEPAARSNPQLRFDVAGLYTNLGTLHQKRGAYRKSLACLRTALSWAAHHRLAHSNYLMTLHYDPAETAESIYRAHREWRREQLGEDEGRTPRPPPGPTDRRPLRLGVFANKLRTGPQTLLYVRAFEALDPDAFEVFVYDQTTAPADAMTERFRSAASAWRSVAGSGDDAVVAQMQADGIDILLNKTGHAEGRIEVLAHRPAPVQVQWGGFNTTGLDSVDWFLADPVECPPGSEAYYSEAIYRLPDDYVIYAPPSYDLAPGALPAATAGRVTFGCFNFAPKINPEIAQLWSRIIAAVPGSRLLLKRGTFDDPDACAEIRDLLVAAGIPAQQVDLRGWSEQRELMATYREVDIALDTWPYSGGLTTLEALWMGVPVVTLPGPTFVGRHAATHLANTGNGDWVCSDAEAYVEQAVSWAQAPEALAELRSQLRARVAASPVCDAPRFARNLEAALLDMWNQAPRRDD